MLSVIIHGCNGHMGRVLSDLIKESDDVNVVAGIDVDATHDGDYPVFTSWEDCHVAADAVIDFSTAKAMDALFDACEKRSLPVVVCTTGLSDAQLTRVDALSQKVPVLRAANMSLGINVLIDTVKKLAPIFAEAGFDIEIVEKHHKRKLDAPSGTAMAFADAMNESLDNAYSYAYDRSTRRESRPTKEIGISAVRGGTIVGEHDIIFAGMDEVVTLRHQAASRSILANGAIEAAKFISRANPGLYDMQNVIAG